MAYQGWNYFVIKGSAGDDAPNEWTAIINILKSIIPQNEADKLINKIEAVAFVIKGTRIARWTIPSTHAEYCTKNETIRVAKKLTWLLMNTIGSLQITQQLKDELKCDKDASCLLFCGHRGECNQIITTSVTKCPLCRKDILFNDFQRNGRKDPQSIQAGHLIPLSRQNNSHNAENIAWFHRRCNYINGEHTLEETIEDLKRIVIEHTTYRE